MKRITLIAIGLLASLFLSSPVLAISNPDSAPVVEEINVYRHLLETNDMLILVYANIPYATTPNETVTQAFSWRLFGSDNVTEIGTATGFAYNDNGFGYNLFSLYFDNSTAPTWGAAYQLKLSGNPLVFASPSTYNFQVASSQYSTAANTTAAQAELSQRVFAIAGALDTHWALGADYSLLLQAEASPVLSVYGEAFFRGAVPGIQAMAPDAFRFGLLEVTATDRTWALTYSENLTNQYAGTWVQSAREASYALFNTDYDLGGVILLVILCLALIVGGFMLTKDGCNGFMDAAVVAVVAARLGIYGLGVLMLITALCLVYIGTRFFGLRG